MRMKFKNTSGSPATGTGFPRTGLGSWGGDVRRRRGLGQLLLVSAASLGVAGLLTACSQLTATLTVDFVYVTSAKAAGPDSYGEVDVFEINSESGHMRRIPTSPFPSGGRNPVAEAVSSDNTNLYVINRDDNSIVQFIIGSDGKLYPQNTVNTPGVFPLAVSVAKTSLYVADTYQPLPTCSPASPCSGSVGVFPILPAAGTVQVGKLQTHTTINSCNGLEYLPLAVSGAPGHVIAPTAIRASADNAYLYITALDAATNTGYLFAYSVGSAADCGNNTSAIPLTPLPGSPYLAGIHPSGVTSDPSGGFVYVTDFASANVRAYSVSAGGLVPLGGSPFTTGNQPMSITIDATGKFAAVADSQDSSVSTFTITNGVLTRIGSFATGLQPVAVGIDPRMNKYIFTANFLGNNVSGFALDVNSGGLLNTQDSPFTANANPTAVAAIPHNGSTK
jgi:6-phosphogluconolactonase